MSGDGSAWIVGKSVSSRPGYWRATSADGVTFTWSHMDRPSLDKSFSAVWGTGPNDTWAAGAYGRLRHWDGTDWLQAGVMPAKTPVTNDLYAMWAAGPHDLWVVGDDLVLHHASNGP
ncbi:hypothetical protein AKJ09_11420 [Labilithrix luteola]|uniref:Uncharacterized protein n=2 Tax=Labilithrix luteola TaxID=1391654 RepID=A0A0K1QGI5_9BACT|nr:hypothetical protein AKJ09_11420 [Labilithrix luteola]